MKFIPAGRAGEAAKRGRARERAAPLRPGQRQPRGPAHVHPASLCPPVKWAQGGKRAGGRAGGNGAIAGPLGARSPSSPRCVGWEQRRAGDGDTPRRRALRGPAPAAAEAGGRPGAAGERPRLPREQPVPRQRPRADPQAGRPAQRHRPGPLQPLPEVPGRAVQQRERQALQPRRHLLPGLPRQPDEREEGGDGGHVQALRLPQRLAGEHHARPGGAQPHRQGAPGPAPQHHQNHAGPHLQPHLPPLQELQRLPGGRELRGEQQGQEHLQEEAAGLPGAQKVCAGHRPGGSHPATSSQPRVSPRPGSSRPREGQRRTPPRAALRPFHSTAEQDPRELPPPDLSPSYLLPPADAVLALAPPPPPHALIYLLLCSSASRTEQGRGPSHPPEGCRRVQALHGAAGPDSVPYTPASPPQHHGETGRSAPWLAAASKFFEKQRKGDSILPVGLQGQPKAPASMEKRIGVGECRARTPL